jgi:hypothetical protein
VIKIEYVDVCSWSTAHKHSCENVKKRRQGRKSKRGERARGRGREGKQEDEGRTHRK